MEVQVKLCGFCNPAFDPEEILLKLKAACPEYNFSYCSDAEKAGLVLNGCQTACVEVPETGKVIIVAGFSVNGSPVEGFSRMLEEVCAQIPEEFSNHQVQRG